MPGKVIAVLSPKGGTGKTTISIGLCRALQLDGYRVVLADSDEQQSALKWSSIEIGEVEMFPVYAISPRNLEREVTRVKESVDFIVIDGGAKLDVSIMAPIIKCADLVLLPVHPSGVDIWASAELVAGIKARQELLEGRPLAYFLVSAQIIGTGMANEVADALGDYGLPVFDSRTSNRIAYPESITSGLTVFEVDRDGKSIGEMTRIKNEVLKVLHG